ncbi:HpcH/HpaI aldolase/citrate lyase family protein [Agrococcus carbonis]|uniref:Citrate lyase subunit beta / citryl-CoA lyase n=1 Tax=Agrococcus carbonis TaxID=684552 RepID=A0A1H1N0M2_9MICO|nr:CoA ester lyase [Agrococcus carbonis]SDR92408.1 citrate lyase subunit beta / citryl-CoA lyase [Agrococcus carbonis]
MPRHSVSPLIARSWLLVPASKPELFEIAQASDADAIIIDIEDAVAAKDKAQARADTIEWLSTGHRAWVRINDAASEFWSTDLAELKEAPGLEGVMLAKTESSSHVDDTADRLPEEMPILALVETARGLQNVAQIASAPSTFRIAFGTGDFKRDTATGEDPIALAYARSQLVIASRAARLPAPIDGPTLAMDALEEGTRLAKEMGMSGKLCLTHTHAATINAGLAPSVEEVAWAHGFVRAFEESGGKITDGSDLPRLARAQKIQAQARDFGIEVDPATLAELNY